MSTRLLIIDPKNPDADISWTPAVFNLATSNIHVKCPPPCSRIYKVPTSKYNGEFHCPYCGHQLEYKKIIH